MKKIITLLAICMFATTGCTKEIISSTSFHISASEVHCGDKIVLSLVASEESNVEYDVTFYWEDKVIGRVDKEPYELEYTIEDVPAGIYTVKCVSKYHEGLFISLSGGSSVSRPIRVLE